MQNRSAQTREGCAWKMNTAPVREGGGGHGADAAAGRGQILSELRTSRLSLPKFYKLYMRAFDELQKLEIFFREETRRGSCSIIDLYKLVQHAVNVLPRLIIFFLQRLDALEKDADLDNVEPNSFHPNSETRYSENSKEVELGDVAKDLNKIKRQNMITHILLGTIIVMTAVWQFNEVLFLLAVQKKLGIPFKSFGELIKGSLKGRGRTPVTEAPPLPPVCILDVTRNDLQMLVIGNEDD